MIAALMAAAVWYLPGWMQTQTPQAGVMPALAAAFPGAQVAFRAWDGDRLVWPSAVAAADREGARLADEIAALPADAREGLVLVGHSLGARIAARALARLAERGLGVRQAVLLAAAISSGDGDLAKMGAASARPVLAVCNPADVTLRYVYALAGGEAGVAFGANGACAPLANVVERVTPPDLTRQVEIDQPWGRFPALKDVANHHALFYLAYMTRLLKGERPSGAVMVMQDLPAVPHKVVDAGVWWRVVAAARGWKLERHKAAALFRIVSPTRESVAWGGEAAMRAAFAKVRRQIGEEREGAKDAGHETRGAWSGGSGVR